VDTNVDLQAVAIFFRALAVFLFSLPDMGMPKTRDESIGEPVCRERGTSKKGHEENV